MKRLFITAIIVGVLIMAQVAIAGRVVLFTAQTDSSVTMYGTGTGNTTGVSVVMRKDQTDFPATFDGIYSLGFPSTITYADTTANPNGTGNADTAGSGVSYYYITWMSKDAPTNAEVEALGTSGVTVITQNVQTNSGSTFSVTFPFTPELGKWLFILASGNTNVHKPGVEVAIQ